MKSLFKILLLLALAALPAFAQVQNMQAASGTTGDLTKPTLGFNFASGQTLNVKSGATVSGAGTFDFTSSTFKVPNSAAPTTAAFGALAADNNAWGVSRGALQFFDGTANTYVVAALASSVPTNGQVPQWQTGGTITWTTLGGTIGGSTGSTDNAVIRADGVGGLTLQSSTATLSDDAILTLPQASLAAATSGDGVIVSNSTAATAGNQRWSPRVRLTGQGWKTTATAGSQTVDWILENRPVQGAANPTTQLAIASQVNAGGYTDRMVFDSGGSIYLGPSASAGSLSSSSGNVAIAAAGSNQNVNITPSGTGLVSAAYPTPQIVLSDLTATRTWQGIANANSYGIYAQNSGSNNTEIHALSLGGGTRFTASIASGSYGSLTATASGVTTAFSLHTYGGSTWTNVGFITIGTSELQSQTARGSEIAFATSLNTTTTRSTQFKITNDGKLTGFNPTGGIGYGTGAGGAVTQGTNRTTGVTLNTISGAITLISAAGTATPQTFTVTNSACGVLDYVGVCQKSGTDLYEIFVTNVAAGSFKITYFTTGGTTTEQPVFKFVIIKAVES